MSEVAPGLVPQLPEEEAEEVVVAHAVELELPVLGGQVQQGQEQWEAVHVEPYRPFQQRTRGRSSHAIIRLSSS